MFREKKLTRARMLGPVITVALLLVAYVLIGAVLPSRRHKSVSPDSVSAFSPGDFYTDDIGPERVACIDGNDEALLWRLRLIRQAQEEVVLSTFDFRPDEAGLDVMAALWDAAERGVRVRVLVDGINGALYLSGSSEMRALAAHENVEVRLYNRIHLLKPWKAQYRMHDKYVISDSAAFLLGGRNTNELFLGQTDGRKNIDRELLVYRAAPAEQCALTQLRAYFETVWADPACSPLKGKARAGGGLPERFAALPDRFPAAFEEPDWTACTMEANRVSLLSNPSAAVNKEPTLWYAAAQLMRGSEDVLIETPYIICSGQMTDELTAITESGTGVRILTNATENGANPFGSSDYLRHKQDILETGAVVYEYCGGHSRHTKTILIGGRMSLIGSYNLDMRSTYLDTELMLAVDCPELNRQLREQADAACEASRLALPDGSYTYGSSYESEGAGVLRMAFYRAFAVLIAPIRHLL